jgi:hypothetical protein
LHSILIKAQNQISKPITDILKIRNPNGFPTTDEHKLLKFCHLVLSVFKPFNNIKQNYTEHQIKKALTHLMRTVFERNENIDQLYQECQQIETKHLIRGIVPELFRYMSELLIEYLILTETLDDAQMKKAKEKLKNQHCSINAYKTIQLINHEAYEKLWKARNEDLAAWEKTNKVTKQMRLAFSTNPNTRPKPRRRKLTKTHTRILTYQTIKQAISNTVPINHLFHTNHKLHWKTQKPLKRKLIEYQTQDDNETPQNQQHTIKRRPPPEPPP